MILESFDRVGLHTPDGYWSVGRRVHTEDYRRTPCAYCGSKHERTYKRSETTRSAVFYACLACLVKRTTGVSVVVDAGLTLQMRRTPAVRPPGRGTETVLVIVEDEVE